MVKGLAVLEGLRQQIASTVQNEESWMSWVSLAMRCLSSKLFYSPPEKDEEVDSSLRF